MSQSLQQHLKGSPHLLIFQEKAPFYSTPKKPFSAHQRFTSFTAKDLKSVKPGAGMTKVKNFSHQKTQSMVVNTRKLEIKIKKLEHIIEKQKDKLLFTPTTQCSDVCKEESSIEVSCSSEDSLNLLRRQVDSVKKLQNNELASDYQAEQCSEMFNLDEIALEQIENKEKGHEVPQSFIDLILFRSIPTIHIDKPELP